MTRVPTHELVLVLDVVLLRAGAGRLGRDGARIAAIAVATWSTIAIGVGGVSLAVGLRIGVAAGLPLDVARAVVVAAIAAAIGASLARLACRSGLAALSARDGLRDALGVRRPAGAAVASMVHVWLLAAATTPLALAWIAMDATPAVMAGIAVAGAVAIAGCLLHARRATDRGGRPPRGGAVLGSVHRIELVAIVAGATILAAGMLPAARAVRDAVAATPMPFGEDGIVGGAIVAASAMVVASDRLLDPRTPARMRRAVALVDAGARPMEVVVLLARRQALAWAMLAGLAVAASLAWGAGGLEAVAAGAAVVAVGAAAEALALGVVAPAHRVMASALVVAVVALVPAVLATGLAAAAIVAAVVVARRRLRCPSS